MILYDGKISYGENVRMTELGWQDTSLKQECLFGRGEVNYCYCPIHGLF
jgi:hypothetical protein